MELFRVTVVRLKLPMFQSKCIAWQSIAAECLCGLSAPGYCILYCVIVLFAESHVGPAQLKNVEKQPEKKQTGGQVRLGSEVSNIIFIFFSVAHVDLIVQIFFM